MVVVNSNKTDLNGLGVVAQGTWPVTSPGTLPDRFWKVRAARRAYLFSLRPDVAEFVLTTTLMFVVVTLIRWTLAADSILAGWPLPGRLTVVGALVGLVLVVLIRSPWGLSSGAHLNPAITVALWLLRVLPGRHVPTYLAAQTAGAFSGVMAARVAWGGVLETVGYGAAAAAPGTAAWVVFAAEAGVPFGVVLAVGYFLTHPRHRRWMAPALGAVTATAIAAFGPSTGGSINPVRQLAPALLSGATHDLTIFLAAPLVGAALAAVLMRPFVHLP